MVLWPTLIESSGGRLSRINSRTHFPAVLLSKQVPERPIGLFERAELLQEQLFLPRQRIDV